MNKNPPQRLSSYDLLRGVAILGVIAVHSAQAFPSGERYIDHLLSFGRFGVQLFFFVSAITMSYMWHKREYEANRIARFYIRRFFRIAPLFWCSIPIYLLINGLQPSYFAPEGINIHQVFLTATFLHGFWPDSINSIVPGGWSIAVEMTFYAIFPLIAIIAGSRARIYLLLAIFIHSVNILLLQGWMKTFFTNHYQTSSTTIINDFLDLNFFNQLPIFLLGCYIYHVKDKSLPFADLIIIFAWLAFAAILKYQFQYSGFGFLLVFSVIGSLTYTCIKRDISFTVLQEIGKYSYSIYLLHFLVIDSLSILIPDSKDIKYLILGMVATTFVSYLLARKIEPIANNFTRPIIQRLL